VEANGDWRDGSIVSRAPARATFRTPSGRVAVSGGDAHEAKVNLE
jgi:hypothetical protein